MSGAQLLVSFRISHLPAAQHASSALCMHQLQQLSEGQLCNLLDCPLRRVLFRLAPADFRKAEAYMRPHAPSLPMLRVPSCVRRQAPSPPAVPVDGGLSSYCYKLGSAGGASLRLFERACLQPMRAPWRSTELCRPSWPPAEKGASHTQQYRRAFLRINSVMQL